MIKFSDLWSAADIVLGAPAWSPRRGVHSRTPDGIGPGGAGQIDAGQNSPREGGPAAPTRVPPTTASSNAMPSSTTLSNPVPMPRLPMTPEEFAQRAFDLELVDEYDLRRVWSDIGTASVTLEEFQNSLIRHDLLTSYQVNRLMRGERSGFYFGEYKALYQVGAGSFARAFRAVHRENGQVVAIKALRSRYNDNPEVTGQFSREGAVGVMLRHPNIVPIYEVVSKEDDHYLVMEFIEDRTLRQFLKVRKRLDPAIALPIIIDIVAGLSHAFERGITHRDIKASNVVITSHGQAKLLDFGLAAVSQTPRTHLIEEGPNPRAIDYVGLERISKVKKNDLRSDIYFAGCMMYQMLSGQTALEETTDRLRRLRTDRYTSIMPLGMMEPKLPRYIARVCEQAMSLDAAARYQRPADMLADLQAAAKRLTGSERPETTGLWSAAAASDLAARDAAATATGDVTPVNGKTEAPVKTTIMVVESNHLMQTIFRQAFRDSGYEVLMSSDPRRALSLFDEDPRTAHCIVLCAGDLGEPALDAFNRFAVGTRTAHVPAVLVLGKNQNEWLPRATVASHRVAVASPVRIRQLREVVANLLRKAE
jgi:eukaryotic-like serine/threonine-protein kinase